MSAPVVDSHDAYVLTVHCSFCGVEAGEPCLPPESCPKRARAPHVSRVKRAARMAIAERVTPARIEDRAGCCECGATWKDHDVKRGKGRVTVTCPTMTQTKED